MHFLCLICRKAFNVGQVTTATHCGHLFHSGCLQQWLEEKSSCPDCRARIVHGLLTAIQLRQDDGRNRQNVEYLSRTLHVRDVAIAKLRQLLTGYEENKKQLAKESASRIMLEKKLQLEQERRLAVESKYQEAESRFQHANQELSRAKRWLVKLRAQKPCVKSASTQTKTELIPKVEQKCPPNSTRVQKILMPSIENIPKSWQLKKRPGLSANANRHQPSSDLSQVIELFRDPYINARVMQSESIADVSIDLDQSLKAQLWSPTKKMARQEKAIGGGSSGVYRM